ncbi:hypothetical protein N0V93_007073 [Gnomoniopsis smithogilvyi]|uniref:NADP-dependent oxidoreductase domain-containing protein n=1 Tax=Gnomoniopsis smithogilvyi TaxID=1191159 RepID=A0A9W9CWA9_9PEZI|nr:hypothetical protein N0V93_007073 [Gnomoniopsis smithogilvyi]
MPSHPRILFGGASIGDDHVTQEEVLHLLQGLKELGIKEIDTARRYPAFNFGASEQLLGQAGAATLGFAIDTKVLVTSADGNGSLTPEKINESADFETPLEDQAAALDALHKAGVYNELGVSNWSEDMLIRFIAICKHHGYIQPSVYQGLYNVLCRDRETLIPVLRANGIVYNAYSPLGGGFLSGKLTSGNYDGTRFAKDNIIGKFSKLHFDKKMWHEAMNSLDETLKIANISNIEAALRWLSFHSQLGPNDGIILGASKLEYIEQNIAAIQKGPLPEDIASSMAKICVVV